MSRQWLARLNQATEYRDLQVVFSEITADVRATPNDSELANCIDEAIRRIQQESLRDENDLQTMEEEYQAFKQQQRGFFGWLRRHLPFTKTRRKEKRHKQAVADRRAEMLADNLIIARAQMIKEQLLPPETRRLGHSASEWQRRLTECDSLATLQEYASLVRQLRDELQQSQAFIEEVDADLNAFANADFSDREDRRRKDADLSAARSDLSALEAEIQSEESLRARSIGRLGEIVSEELTSHDADYRALEQRITLLETASRCAKDAEESFEELQSTIKSMRKSADELESIPGRRDELIEQSRQIERDAEDAERRRAQIAADQADHKNRYADAKDKFERAQAGVEAARDVYQAYLAETGHAELPSNDSSLVAAEYTRRQNELREAESVLRTVAAPYEVTKAELQRAEQDAAGLQKRQAEVRREEDSLGQRSHKLRADLNSAHDQLRRTIERADRNANDYLESLRPLDRDESLQEFERILPSRHWGSSGLAPASDNQRELKRSEELYTLVRKHLHDVRKSLDRDFFADQKQRQSAWIRRCTELLGDDLSAEICQQSPGPSAATFHV